MNKIPKLPIFLTLLIALGGCSGLSKKECLEQDWVSTGESEGRDGELAQEKLDYYQKECGRHGTDPDVKSYEHGHYLGLRDFCKDVGEEHGAKGKLKKMPKICRGMKSYDLAVDNGFLKYCKKQGEKAGAQADKRVGDRNCWYKKTYRSGFVTGLRDHCVESRGLELGLKGFAHRPNLCAKNLRFTFNRGHQKGLRTYCRKENGFALSQSKGHFAPKLCSVDQKKDFLDAYNKGLRYSALTKKIPELDSLMLKKREELKEEKIKKKLKVRIEQDIRKLEKVKKRYVDEKEDILHVYKD